MYINGSARRPKSRLRIRARAMYIMEFGRHAPATVFPDGPSTTNPISFISNFRRIRRFTTSGTPHGKNNLRLFNDTIIYSARVTRIFILRSRFLGEGVFYLRRRRVSFTNGKIYRRNNNCRDVLFLIHSTRMDATSTR